MRMLLLWPMLVILLAGSARDAYADATVTVCGKDSVPGDPRVDLTEALAVGGRIEFVCSGVIAFTGSHALLKDAAIDGGGAITLDGKGNRMFGMGSGRSPKVSFKRIRIEGGGVGSSGLPGGVISGEGNVSLLEGTIISKSQKPVWVIAGSLEVRGAWFAENVGPVVVVSEGTLVVSNGTRFTDNVGQVIGTGPATRTQISDTQFFRNGGSNFGGTAAKGCEVAIAGSWFADNRVAEDGGAFTSRCKLTVENTQFERNHAGRDGGAMYLGVRSEVTMRAVQFRDNQAVRSGGAIASIGDLAGGSALRVNNGRFERNIAGAAGGAISAGEAGRVEIGVGAFVGNVATTAGGAMYVRQSPLKVSRSLFLRNRSSQTGGAIESFCMPATGGQVTNTIFASNVAANAGAFFGTQMTFVNTSIVSNGNRPVQQGQNCSGASAISFVNTIIEGGFTGGCSGGDANRIYKDLGHNIQFPGKSCGATIASVPPLLGLYFTPFRPFSPAGSAGDKAICLSPPVDGRDIYGAHRTQGTTCSIGAVEGDLTNAIRRAFQPPRGESPQR
ncbi:hypothetical protein [Edaphobacter modestus]|uniref:Putative outer membrane repeat protein n=1 Tax=Edaphobacter modestus TaxID=388466 RepID=A0A4Q7YT36_9BACT|nr:hypothetical protein [Edaphobacter modestus]RZU40035.1 putative outer membrane repeat protein [Edaphobacter modestus]